MPPLTRGNVSLSLSQLTYLPTTPHIQVNFPSEEKRGANGVTFYYSPLIEYKIPVFRHPGAAMRTMAGTHG